ncbi:MAG: hypothetical protein GXO84_09690 [Chlorobi bacterium]|nr:hypothetical protein [Chlorobiota bacterium]
MATHSETAQSLGIKGMYDLKDNFDSILRLKNIKGERLVDVDDGLDLTTYHHTGSFNQPMANNLNNKLDSILDKTLIKDQGIVDTYEQLKASGEFTWNKFTLAIYNKKGGHYVNQLKAVLNAHEIAYS